jgi:hypothetical protein
MKDLQKARILKMIAAPHNLMMLSLFFTVLSSALAKSAFYPETFALLTAVGIMGFTVSFCAIVIRFYKSF